jgi:hypothetical protein
MGKLAENPRGLHRPNAKRDFHRLQDERRKLSGQLAKLDRQLAKLAPVSKDKKAPNSATLNRWLDELSEGLEHLPSLPADFSRADLYDDHD